MLERLGGAVFQRRWAVLAVTGVLLAAAGLFGGGVFGAVKSGGFTDPAAPSSKADRLLAERFGAGDANLVLIVTAGSGTVDDPAVAAAGQALTTRLAADPQIAYAASYWTLGGAPPLRSTNGNRALVLARITGDDTEAIDWLHDHRSTYEYTAADGTISVAVSGITAAYEEVGRTVESDLVRAERIAFPITALGLLLVFGSVVAAALPLLVGVIAIVATLAVLHALALLTDVSVYSINLTTALGLGLAVDYSLFVVSRYREEVARNGGDHRAAVVRSVSTAGRTVLFSAVTVAASLIALLVFPFYFLRSFAFAGAAVVAVAALAAVTTLPAVLAVLGPERLEKLRIRRRAGGTVAGLTGAGFWHRLAGAVMRRPVRSASAVIVVLLVLGAPFLGVQFGYPDDRVLPEGAVTRRSADIIRAEFARQEQAGVGVAAPGLAADDPRLAGYAAALSQVRGAARVDTALGSFVDGRLAVPAAAAPPIFARFHPLGAQGGTWLNVVPSVEPLSEAGERLAEAVRAIEAPAGGDVLVGGQSAAMVDAKLALGARLPVAGGIIALITLIVLFAMFGSLLVPAKAVVLNLLSLTATFGAMVFVFQDGHGAGLLGFTATGALLVTMPVLMFCIAFGLSMDYEVFLLSRIKEQHDAGAGTIDSVAVGLEQTGRIVTAAAALLAIVFVAFATSGISFMKLFGVGLTLAVLMDATLIRGVLVPAFMRLAGEANWWAPGPLRRLHARFGISESEGVVATLPRPTEKESRAFPAA
ncbi:MAG TPA: MMPL family transporter [Acidimicrobiia bacterium]|nr:MMPL family transporter [Acidimicrobiia bacterium]